MLRCALPLLLPLLVVVGCGDVTHQTRYIPRVSELTWDAEYEQLPWRPPALTEAHYPRTGRPAKPMYPYEGEVDVQWPAEAWYYAGDGSAADRAARAGGAD